MNPGSSQFASQFPDAEETMSKMESKKLQTIEGFTPGPWFFGYENADFSGGGQWYILKDGDGNSLLWFPYNSTSEIENIAEANADLMAYAPELYRIAHEQREVICELVKAIKLVRRGVDSMPSSFGFKVSEIPCIDRVLAAAAPYIQED